MIDLRSAPAPRSLYVHFPFCRQRCHYCDFSVARARRPPRDAWLAAIRHEVAEWFESTGWRPGLELETIYVGGGTPSLLGCGGMQQLGDLLREWFRWTPERVEWTAEANPASLTSRVCQDWLAAGVNRLSIGVQSFDDGALDWLGRAHDGAEATAAVRRARSAGFDSLSADLMFALPESVPREWGREVAACVELGVSHVSAYGLAVEPRTALGRWVELGRRQPAGEEHYAAEYLEAAERLGAAGFTHYEVSNFARPGHESRHNWHYWDGSGYLGVGPSAHSYLPPLRIWNLHRWDAFHKAVASGASVRAGWERIGARRTALERVWLGLRTRRGIGFAEVERLSPSRWNRLLAHWTGEAWIEQDGDRWRLTPRGWLLLDRLALELDATSDVRVRSGHNGERVDTGKADRA